MAEDTLSDLIVYNAQPTVRVDRQDIALVEQLAVAMTMLEQEGGLSSLELRLNNIAPDPAEGNPYAFEDDGTLRLGSTIEIYGGDLSAPQEIFRGIITGLEGEFPEDGPPELVVLAEDRLQQARMERRTKTYDDTTLKKLVEEIAGRLGLTPVVTEFTDNIGTWVQLNESDLAFLRRVLVRHCGDLQVVGEELHVSPRGDVQRGTPELELYSQLRRARVVADLAHQVSEVTVSGWDAIQGEPISATSTGADLGPGSGQTGATLLESALARRPHHISHLTVQNKDEATSLANAEFDRRARQLVTIEATAEGNPGLRVGTNVKLMGIGPRFENTYFVTRACHRWDLLRGYETDFTAECAYWGGAA